jgi:hypothetical protein
MYVLLGLLLYELVYVFMTPYVCTPVRIYACTPVCMHPHINIYMNLLLHVCTAAYSYPTDIYTHY